MLIVLIVWSKDDLAHLDNDDDVFVPQENQTKNLSKRIKNVCLENVEEEEDEEIE